MQGRPSAEFQCHLRQLLGVFVNGAMLFNDGAGVRRFKSCILG
jgi:hypothetical protein